MWEYQLSEHRIRARAGTKGVFFSDTGIIGNVGPDPGALNMRGASGC